MSTTTTKSACRGCRHAYNSIQGLRCNRMKRGVEYSGKRCENYQPSELIPMPTNEEGLNFAH